MKKILLLSILFTVVGFAAIAQVPQAFNYQGVARNSSGAAYPAGTTINLRLTVLDLGSLGTPLYQETQSPTTNQFGLFTVAIGTGIPTGLAGTMAFSAVPWGTGAKYLRVEMMPPGSSSYDTLGVSQLLSVPYAMFAGNGGGGSTYTAGTGISISGSTINANNTNPIWNADEIQGVPISTVAATAGEVLALNGGIWTPTTTATSGWSLTGNSGTNSGVNFIGTTDTAGLSIRVDNQSAGKISSVTYSSTSFGYQALNVNTAQVNTAFGYQALKANTTGNGNTAHGTYALANNIVGINNTAVGEQSLYNNTDSFNTAIGYQALYNNSTGYSNTAIGSQELYSNTTGSKNVSIGSGGLGNTTGSGNINIGWASLTHNATGSYNTALGYMADLYSCCPNLSNTVELGYNAGVANSNNICIGNSSITSITAQVDLTITSDARVKNQVQSNVPGLSFIMLLHPVTYHYDVRKENELLGIKDTANWEGKYDIEKMTFSGFLAQEVSASAQRIGYDFSGVDKSHNVWGIKYSDFIPSIVKSEQELNAKNEALEKTVAELQSEVNELMKEMKEMKK